MRFQNIPLPDKSEKIGETPWLNHENTLHPILKKHMAPKGKVAVVIIKKGSLDFVWEDQLLDVITGDKDHPIVIEPERYHHIILTGPVEYIIKFYKDNTHNIFDEVAVRPGEQFIQKKN